MSDVSFHILAKGASIYRDESGLGSGQLSRRRNRRSVKGNQEVIYQIFKDAADLIKEDNFWFCMLEDFSKGIFPSMYRFNGKVLSFKKRTKVYSKEICQDSPEMCLKNTTDFMKNNGFHSNLDHKRRVENIEVLRLKKSKVILAWSGIRSRKTKKLLISMYTARLGEKYGLTILELSKLSNLVMMINSVGIINKNRGKRFRFKFYSNVRIMRRLGG